MDWPKRTLHERMARKEQFLLHRLRLRHQALYASRCYRLYDAIKEDAFVHVLIQDCLTCKISHV